MEFNEKLQSLRKQKGITQEELASVLYVSRTAVSKWESGRGYPTIESLKAIADFYGLSVDELLSSGELLAVAEKSTKQQANYFRDLVWGLLDLSVVMLLFLPFFGERTNGTVYAVSLLNQSEITWYLTVMFYAIVIIMAIIGVLTLALQNCEKDLWVLNKRKISLIFNLVGAVIFVVSLQPYAATLLLLVLIFKVLMLVKK